MCIARKWETGQKDALYPIPSRQELSEDGFIRRRKSWNPR
jgi:hypothetical protein